LAGVDALEAFADGSPDVWRAIVLADQGATFFDIMRAVRAGVMIGEIDFLAELFNQTGWEREIGAAAAEFLARTEDAGAVVSGSLEDNWLFLYDQIAERRGLEALQSAMIGFESWGRNRHYAGIAQVTADWMRAIDKIGPFVRGDQADPPPRPANLSDDFDWETWVRLATGIPEGIPSKVESPGEAMMMAELLVPAGQEDAAIAFAAETMQMVPRLNFLSDLIKRMDRRCQAYSVSEGQAIYLRGLTAYRF